MTDEQLKEWHERFRIGDVVRHYGTKQFGTVCQVMPTHYGVELVVDRIVDHPWDQEGRGYWEGIRIDIHRRNGEVLRWR